MKKSIPIFFGLLLISVGGFLFFPAEKSVPDEAMVDDFSSESGVVQKDKVEGDAGTNEAGLRKGVSQNNEPPTPEMSHAELQGMTEATLALRNEIDDLILQFDAHLSDPETRKEMKEKIDAKLAEYNRMVLPVAISEMRNSVQ